MATLGLIIGGVTTPTDAAATGAFASLVLTALYGRLKFQALKRAVFRTMETSASIMFLIGAANFFGAVFARMGSGRRSEEHTSELQSLMRISYAVLCLKKKIGRKSHMTT